ECLPTISWGCPMIRFSLLAAFAAVAASPLTASQPGQPIDCSDWVPVQPGFTCVPYLAYPCDPSVCTIGGEKRARRADNEGFLVYVREESMGIDPTCGREISRLEIVRQSGANQTVLGYFQTRCNGMGPGGYDNMIASDPSTQADVVEFDAAGGRLYV